MAIMEGSGHEEQFTRTSSLHEIIVEYVSHHAYINTAHVLARCPPRRSATTPLLSAREDGDVIMGTATGESSNGASNGAGPSSSNGHTADSTKGLQPIDLQSIERRRVILNYILDGAIMRAIEALNTDFPDVLAGTESMSPSQPGESTTPTSFYSNGLGKKPANLTPAPAARNFMANFHTCDHTRPVFVDSTDAVHVKLNLEIQQFIETFRQLAPSSPSSPASSISSLTSSMHVSVSNIATSNAHNGTSSGVTLTNALTAAQGLHAQAKMLHAETRAAYLQEIKDVGALFAYTNPETSILKGFLDQSRRIALAEQVNAAILKSMGKEGNTALGDIAQRTEALYSILSERQIDPRPPANSGNQTKDLVNSYWKHQTGPFYEFSLDRFVDQ